jgi:protein transport protein SEC13
VAYRDKDTMADNVQNVDLFSIEANETQHDAVLDYYGRRLATCSSDKTIKIFEVEGDKHTLVETLRGYVTTTTRSRHLTLTAQ